MSRANKYRAFLSYSHQDRKWAGRLHRALERYRIPKHLGEHPGAVQLKKHPLRPIFRDRDELSGGSNLSQKITEALDESESLIVICSPSAVASQWVNDEIRTFQRLGKCHQIFCFIVSGKPFSGDEEECFPEALRHPVDTDGVVVADPEEPIAADASGGKKEWQHAKLMLIAGLLGVGLDELVRRDLQRRNRNMMAVAAGSAVIALIMAGLTVFAFLSQAEAERRQADADNLVSFLMDDLQDDLSAIGRLDLFDSVAAKSMEYFESLEGDDARDEVLAQRAEALRLIGQAMLDRSDMEGAKKAFDESLSINLRLVEQNPERLDWNVALAESHFKVGKVHWLRGDLDDAAAAFKNQLKVMDALAAAQTDDLSRLENSAYAWTNYGRVLELAGDYEEGLHAYQTVMDMFQRLSELSPENEDVRLEVGFAHNNLGKLKTELGLLDSAEAHYQSDLQIKKEVSETDRSNNLYRGYLAASHYWLGNLQLMRGALDEAGRQLNSSLALLEDLLLNEPDSMGARQRKAAVHTQLAKLCRLNQDTECASTNIESALIELLALTTANPDNARVLRHQAYSRLEAAWQAAQRGEQDLALQLAEDSRKSIGQLTAHASFDIDLRKLKVLALLTLGDLADQSGFDESATSSWEAAWKEFNQYFKTSNDPKALELQSSLLSRAGQAIEAQRIDEQLTRMGYLSSYPW